MSEYQYYEFAAVEHPLTKAQMSKLRAISSRARITPRRFTNTYNWGDFKGDPKKLMEEFFDAHLYTSNFGIRHLYLRVPSAALALKSIEGCFADECFDAWQARGNVILHFELSNENNDWDDDYDWGDDDEEYYDEYEDDDEAYDDFEDEDDEDENADFDDTEAREVAVNDSEKNYRRPTSSSRSLDALLALRDELARGDLRALYLGWLTGVQRWEWGAGEYKSEEERKDDTVVEPPVPPGLGTLTDAQLALADFLKIDRDLITAAAEQSASIKSKTAASATTPATAPETAPRRTADALLHRAREVGKIREQREAEEAAHAEAERARKAAEAREKHLDRQAAREYELWPAVHKHIASRLPREYDTAIALLLDLRDLARRRGNAALAVFVGELCELKDTHKSRTGLIRRINAAFAKNGGEKAQ